MHNLEYLRGIT